MVLARWASYDKKMLARQVIPLAPGFQTALSSRPVRCMGNYRGAELGEAKIQETKKVKKRTKTLQNVMNSRSCVGPSTSFKTQSPTFHSLWFHCPCFLTIYCCHYNSNFFYLSTWYFIIVNVEETLCHLLKGLWPPQYHIPQTNQRVYQHNILFSLPRSVLFLPLSAIFSCTVFRMPFFELCPN